MLTEQSLSTCTGPYHLETFLISIILSAMTLPFDVQRMMAIFL
jgi:hypothetical protein